ncbi:MAG: homocysteine S-methyltransferase family protein [Clostridia bacterium]|nr:homocysteine S-methyltransferase family protein [Clostridia bacterium]
MELFNKFTFLDGGFGTMLVAKGLKAGELPEEYNIEKPEIVQSIHKAYIDAGSDIILTNTFGANKKKMSRSKYPLSELIKNAVLNAKKATEGTNVKIALDLGPIGELIEPMGMMTFEEAVDVFKESISIGVENGVDLIYFETMSDLYELKAAIIAAKECCDKPIFSTMTFEQSMRTFMGCSIPSMAVLLEGMGVSALGINCSLGPKEMLPIVKELINYTNLPIIVKPNAGLPEMVDGKATYSITPEEFSDLMIEYAKLGINIFGGCCGTSPDYIRKTKEKISSLSPVLREKKSFTAVCSPSNTVIIDKTIPVGEKINPTGKEDLQKAIMEEDIDSIVDLGYDQMDCDAKILDVNVGLYGIDEAYIMEEAVKALQTAINLPLQIDSSDPKVIEAGIRIYNGKPIINSVNGKKENLDKILPLAKKYGACVIGLTMDENGIPEKAEGRVKIAEKIIEECKSHGIAKENIIIDCLALCKAVSSEQETLKAVNMISKMGYKTILGISNVSFGLPNRSEINHDFLKKAIEHGLSMAIINPEDDELMGIF